MADHATPEYATATGNDYVEHEGTYHFFVKMTMIGALSVFSFMIALAIGGVNGYWGLFTLGMLAIVVATAVGLASETGKPGLLGGILVALVLLLILTS